MEKQWKQWETLFPWAPKSLQMVTAAMELKFLGRKSVTNLDSILKSRDITWLTKVCLVKAMVFLVVMYGCDSWPIKKLSAEELMLWTVVLEKNLETPLDCKEIKPAYPKGNQPWIFIGRTDAKAEALILWPPGEELTHWKRPWRRERLRAWGERGVRGWDG